MTNSLEKMTNKPILLTNQRHESPNPNSPLVANCPRCGKKVAGKTSTRFCRFCGQAVVWFERKKDRLSDCELDL